MTRQSPSRTGTALAAMTVCLSFYPGLTPVMGQPSGSRVEQTTLPAARGARLAPVEVRLNGAALDVWILLQEGGSYWLDDEAIGAWRLREPDPTRSRSFRGRTWHPLDQYEARSLALDEVQQILSVELVPEAFRPIAFGSGSRGRAELSPQIPAAFLNADLSLDASTSPSVGDTQAVGGIFEAGFSTELGLFTSSFFSRQTLSGPDALSENDVTYKRLETRFQKNFVDDQTTLRLGDSVTRSGQGGRSNFFTGVQFGRNFGLSPGQILQPIPSILGSASTASTVELYVNDALRRTGEVPPGQFTIDNVPILTGQGDVRLVVRDLLGRETVITRQLYVGNTLLAEGLSDFSLEAGLLRSSIGSNQDRYGDAFASGFGRIGRSDTQTLEASFALSGDVRQLGLGVSQVVLNQLVGFAFLSGSQSDRLGTGLQSTLGLERQGLQHGVTLQRTDRTDDYAQLGTEPGSLPLSETSLAYRFALPEFGSLGLSYAAVQAASGQEIQTLVGSYSRPILERATLLLNLIRVDSGRVSDSVTLSVVMPFESRRSITTSVTNRDGQNDSLVSVNQTPPGVYGAGYRLAAGERGGAGFAEGNYFQSSRRGQVSGDLRSSDGASAARLNYRGALVAADGLTALTPLVNSGLAVVEARNLPNVGILSVGQEAARTNAEGKAIVTGLFPYTENLIRLSAQDIPLFTEVGSLEQRVVPADRGAVKIAYEVRSGRAVLLKIDLEDGEPAPPGAVVQLAGSTEEFYVARRGEVYLTSVPDEAVLTLDWRGKTCPIQFSLPPLGDLALSRLGPVVCKGVTR